MVPVPNRTHSSVRIAAAVSRPRPGIARGAARRSSPTPITATPAERASPLEAAALDGGTSPALDSVPGSWDSKPRCARMRLNGAFLFPELEAHVAQRAAPTQALPDQAVDRRQPLGRPRRPEAHDRTMRRHESRRRGGYT